jgi:hypothetical protein
MRLTIRPWISVALTLLLISCGDPEPTTIKESSHSVIDSKKVEGGIQITMKSRDIDGGPADMFDAGTQIIAVSSFISKKEVNIKWLKFDFQGAKADKNGEMKIAPLFSLWFDGEDIKKVDYKNVTLPHMLNMSKITQQTIAGAREKAMFCQTNDAITLAHPFCTSVLQSEPLAGDLEFGNYENPQDQRRLSGPPGSGNLKICMDTGRVASYQISAATIVVPKNTRFGDAGKIESRAKWWRLQVTSSDAVSLSKTKPCAIVGASVFAEQSDEGHPAFAKITNFQASDRRFLQVLGVGLATDFGPPPDDALASWVTATAETDFK